MKHLVTSLVLACATAAAHAHGVTAGTLAIAHPYAYATPPGATTGGGYLKEVANRGDRADTLIGASSPLAEQVQIHDLSMDGNVMRMRAIPSVPIAAGQQIAMKPGGGVHLMFIGLRKPWMVGDRIPATLQFERAGKVDVILNVEERGAPSTEHAHTMSMP